MSLISVYNDAANIRHIQNQILAQNKNDASEKAGPYLEQYTHPYECTIKFYDFLKQNNAFIAGKTYLDIGCGYGCVTNYFAAKEEQASFIGLDYNPEVVSVGAQAIHNSHIKNARIGYGDWFDLPKDLENRFEGIFNTHALCCFKDYKTAIQRLVDLNPKWVAFNSLFWDGLFEVYIHTKNSDYEDPYDKTPDADFNTFSIPTFRNYLLELGYPNFQVERFEISSDLPKPAHGRRQTYTVETEWSTRTQFSGPIHLPWHFIFASKE